MSERDPTGGTCYGLDIGGSKIELVAFDGAMRAVHRQRIDTPHESYAAFLDAVRALVARADADLVEGDRPVELALARTAGRETQWKFLHLQRLRRGREQVEQLLVAAVMDTHPDRNRALDRLLEDMTRANPAA